MNAKKLMNFKSRKNEAETSKKPRISKTAVFEQPQPDAVEPATPDSVVVAEPVKQPDLQVEPHGQHVQSQSPTAEKTMLEQRHLLAVETYDDAEALLSANPDLIETARDVFGSIVPTTNQNRFMELAILAAASDDPLTLGSALQAKRRERLNLSLPEVKQLLEFASQNSVKSPELSLFMAILITDDLTYLKETDLWQSQKAIVTKTAKQIGVDPLAIWEEINGKAEVDEPVVEETTRTPSESEIKAEATATPTDKDLPIPPRPKSKRTKTRSKRIRYEIRRIDGPPRWLMAMGLLGLTTLASCGVCALAIF